MTTPGQAIVALDQMQGAIQMYAGFLVHGNPVGAGRGKLGNELVRILDHQVAIERQLGHLAQGLHQRRSHGQVGHEMTVHDIHMDDCAAARGSVAHLVRQMGEVSRQNRGCEFNQPGPRRNA